MGVVLPLALGCAGQAARPAQAPGTPAVASESNTGDAAAAPAPPATYVPPPAKFLPPNVANKLRITDPHADPVILPPRLAFPGAKYWAMVRLCVTETGDVFDVKLIKKADADVDPLIVAKLMTWKYRPAITDGVAARFCTLVRYEIEAKGPPRRPPPKLPDA